MAEAEKTRNIGISHNSKWREGGAGKIRMCVVRTENQKALKREG